MLRSYTPADFLTIGNAACGTIAIFLCLDYLATDSRRFLWIAFFLLPLALVCDVLDGYVARLDKKRQSTLGADLGNRPLAKLPQRLHDAKLGGREVWAAGHYDDLRTITTPVVSKQARWVTAAASPRFPTWSGSRATTCGAHRSRNRTRTRT